MLPYIEQNRLPSFRTLLRREKGKLGSGLSRDCPHNQLSRNPSVEVIEADQAPLHRIAQRINRTLRCGSRIEKLSCANGFHVFTDTRYCSVEGFVDYGINFGLGSSRNSTRSSVSLLTVVFALGSL